MWPYKHLIKLDSSPQSVQSTQLVKDDSKELIEGMKLFDEIIPEDIKPMLKFSDTDFIQLLKCYNEVYNSSQIAILSNNIICAEICRHYNLRDMRFCYMLCRRLSVTDNILTYELLSKLIHDKTRARLLCTLSKDIDTISSMYYFISTLLEIENNSKMDIFMEEQREQMNKIEKTLENISRKFDDFEYAPGGPMAIAVADNYDKLICTDPQDLTPADALIDRALN